MKLLNLALWDVFGRFSNYVVLLLVSVILARLLEPAEFGIYGIVFSIVTLSSVFLDFGFKSAIVQAEDISQEKLSTIFFINLALALFLTFILCVAAPSIESFYEINNLSLYIFAASTMFVLTGLAIVPTGILQRDLKLKQISIINTIAACSSAVVAIAMAAYGFRVWSFVGSQLFSTTIYLVGTFIASRWKPNLEFNLASINQYWKYGSKLFLSGLLDSIYTRLDVFIIGKLFDVTTLGFYNRAQSLDAIIRQFTAGTLVSVSFPVLSRLKDNLEQLRLLYEKALNMMGFLAFLLTGVLVLTAADIITILFTEKWLPTVGYFRIIALTSFVYPISAVMVTILSARGNSTAFLKLEIWKKLVLTPVYFTFIFGGIYAFLFSMGFASVIALILNAVYVKKEINIALKLQFWTIGKYCLAGIVSFVGAYAMTRYFESNIYLHLIASSLTFLLIYSSISYALQFEGLMEFTAKVKDLINDKRNANISAAA